MTRLLPALAALLLAGCATAGGEPESLVDHPVYQAFGSPSWQLAIGDDIALRLGHDHFDGDGARGIEAVDMARRALHNEGAELLRDCLAGKVEVDFDTARRLFTLICVLHIKQSTTAVGSHPRESAPTGG